MDEHTSHELAYKKGYEKGKQDAMKWIPVTERLPENTEKVLALSKSRFGNGYLSWLVRYNPDAGTFYDYDSEWGNIKIHNITHWMPLPSPPSTEVSE